MKFALSPAAAEAKVRPELNSIIAVFYLQTRAGIKFTLHALRVCVAVRMVFEYNVGACVRADQQV
jgi:hypothetical protein